MLPPILPNTLAVADRLPAETASHVPLIHISSLQLRPPGTVQPTGLPALWVLRSPWYCQDRLRPLECVIRADAHRRLVSLVFRHLWLTLIRSLDKRRSSPKNQERKNLLTSRCHVSLMSCLSNRRRDRRSTSLPLTSALFVILVSNGKEYFGHRGNRKAGWGCYLCPAGLAIERRICDLCGDA